MDIRQIGAEAGLHVIQLEEYTEKDPILVDLRGASEVRQVRN